MTGDTCLVLRMLQVIPVCVTCDPRLCVTSDPSLCYVCSLSLLHVISLCVLHVIPVCVTGDHYVLHVIRIYYR